MKKFLGTILQPVEAAIFTASTSRQKLAPFYEEKLKADGWIVKSRNESGKVVRYQFSKSDFDKILNLFIAENPPSFFPKELGLAEETYISLHFSP